MRRKLSIALAVALGAFAALANSAWAVNEYEGPKGLSFGGEQHGNHVFEFGSLKVECERAEFGGSLSALRTTVVEEKLKSYAECKMLGFSPPTVLTSTSGCIYKLFLPMGGPTTFHALWEILGSSCEVVFEVPSVCTIKFDAQTAEFEVEEANEPTFPTMHVDFSIPSLLTQLLSYSWSSLGGSGCTGIGLGSDGTYKGREVIENLVIV